MQTLNIDPPMGSIMLLTRRSNACKIRCKRWILSLPWAQLCYPHAPPMRVKYDANVEYWPSHGINHGAMISLNACKRQYERWIYSIPRHQPLYPDIASMRVRHNTNRWICSIPRHQSRYPDIASMRVKRNTNVEFIASLGINHGTLISPQCV